MATVAAMAIREANARERMRLASGRIVKRLGMDEPADTEFTRDPQLRRIKELEAHADFLEAANAAIKAKGFSTTPGDEGESASIDLNTMKLADLKVYAKERGLEDADSYRKKADLIAAIDALDEPEAPSDAEPTGKGDEPDPDDAESSDAEEGGES